MVVAQLAERSLPTPEVRGSNPVIGKNYNVPCQLYGKDENKEKKTPGISHRKKFILKTDECAFPILECILIKPVWKLKISQ